MAKPVIIEIIGKDGASKVLKPIANELRGIEDAGERSAAGTAKAGKGMVGLATKVGGLATAYFGLSQVASAATEGFVLTAGLDQSRRSIGTLMRDVEKGNKVYQDAIKWGREFGFTQQEMASSTAAAATILRDSNQTTEKSLEVLARLASLNPAEGIEGAVVAVKELASGDIVSLAERFNISKDAARAMKDEIAAGADPIAVLDKALSDMGVSSEVLANRMEGPNGAILRMKQSGEDAKLALGNLLISMGAPQVLEAFAGGLNNIAAGLQHIATFAPQGLNGVQLINAALTDGAARMLANGRTYQEYVAAMNSIGQSSAIMSQEAWNASAALQAKGMSTQQATAAVQAAAGVEGELRHAILGNVDAAQMSEAAQAALVQRVLELAGANPQAAATVQELVDSWDGGRGPMEDFTAGLENGEVAATNHAAAAAEDSAMMQLAASDAEYAAGATDTLSASVYQLTNDQYAQTEASLEAAIAAENEASFQHDLANAVALSGDNAALAAYMSSVLSGQYGIEASKVQALIGLHNQLHIARATGQGKGLGAIAGGIANRATEGPGGLAGYHERNVDRAARAERGSAPKGRKAGGGGGAKGGKSEAVKEQEREEKELKKITDRMAKEAEKFNDKMLKLDEEHIANERKIWDDYYAKQLAALTKFNGDKFQDELSFKDSLKGMDAQARAAMIAEERKAWDEAQAIAQAGNPKLADEYYKLKLEQIQANQERADELAAIEQQISEETDAAQKARLEQERAYLQQLDAEHDKYDAEDLEKLRAGGDQLAQERDEQLAEEEQRYAEAGATLKEEYAKNVASIIEEGGKIGQAFADIGSAAQAAAEAARAAIASIPSAPAAAGGEAPMGPYAIGTGDRGLPRRGLYVGDPGEIVATKADSDVVRGHGGLASTLRKANLLDRGIRDNAPRSSGGGTTNNITIAPTFPNSTAPRRDVELAKGDIRQIVLDVIKEKEQGSARIQRGGGY